jgi:hypothetical protein
VIFNYINQLNAPTGDVTDSLENKILSAILQDQDDIAKRIIEFSGSYEKVNRFILQKLREEFVKAVRTGEFSSANKFYAFDESNKLAIFKDALLKHSCLHDDVHAVKRGDNTNLTNVLKFAKEHSMLPEVFKADVCNGKNLLEFAEEKGVKANVE